MFLFYLKSQVNIRLDDVNDNSATIDDDNLKITILDSVPPRTVIHTIRGEDPDLGNNSTLIYEIIDPGIVQDIRIYILHCFNTLLVCLFVLICCFMVYRHF